MSGTAPDQPKAAAPVVVKKYANRRLYNTESSSYITLENLAEMIRSGRDFVVYDAKTNEDITRQVLTQIIVEEEGKGEAMLPTSFLRQLIGMYGEDMQGLVPRYLEQAMDAFARQQDQMRTTMQQAMSKFGMPNASTSFPQTMALEEISRQNMAMMERAMSLFTPFYRPPGEAAAAPQPTGREAAPPVPATPQAREQPDLADLRAEVESLRKQLAEAQAMVAKGRKTRGST
jgi:polyhydroxyalkanoate synthesis repressor PhaR